MRDAIIISVAVLIGFVGVTVYIDDGKHRASPPVATIAPAAPTPKPAPTPKKPDLKVLSWNCTQSYGFVTVSGEVRNETNAPISNLMVVSLHYSSDQQLIRSDSGMVDYNPIMPGQTSPFKTMGTLNPMMRTCRIGFKQMFGGAVSWDN